MTFLLTLVFFMQKVGDCDFFEWADKKMSAYEKGLAQHLKEMEERRQADNDKVEELIGKNCKDQLAQQLKEMEEKVEELIEKKCKEQLAQHLKEMEEKVEELIEKKCKEQLAQRNEKMFRVLLLVVILLLALAFYFCSYSEPRHTNLMLE
jgi:CHASE3 domain sensor protein